MKTLILAIRVYLCTLAVLAAILTALHVGAAINRAAWRDERGSAEIPAELEAQIVAHLEAAQ